MPLGFISGLVGGLIGARGARRGAEIQSASAERQAAENVAFQREFAQHGVQWRAEDAERAGVHPLFALQGGGATFSPNPIVAFDGGRAESARQIGDAVSRAGQSANEFTVRQAALDASAAATEKDRAIADYYRSEAARARQGANVSKPLQSDVVVQGTPNLSAPMESYYDRRVVQANPTFSRDSNRPSVGAGSSPFWRSYEFSPGKMIDLPHTEEGPSESLQNLSIVQWPFVIAENMEHYGPQWLADMASIITPFIDAARDKARGAINFEDRSWNRGE